MTSGTTSSAESGPSVLPTLTAGIISENDGVASPPLQQDQNPSHSVPLQILLTPSFPPAQPSVDRESCANQSCPIVSHSDYTETSPSPSPSPNLALSAIQIGPEELLAQPMLTLLQGVERGDLNLYVSRSTDKGKVQSLHLDDSPSTLHTAVLYGFDVGKPDLENRECDDSNFITDFRPPERVSALQYGRLVDKDSRLLYGKSGPNEQEGTDCQRLPSIRIPASLIPLPDILLSSQVNLLYFHHFINSTANLIMAQKCSKNPFKLLLPSR